MTPVDKGRFCDSCQKNVIDFSRSPDREIAAAFAKDDNLCGRFLDTQLGRDLILPAERSSWWITASAAVLSVMAASTAANAQTSVPKTQTEVSGLTSNTATGSEFSGVVSDDGGLMPGATVKNLITGISTSTDIEGNFTIPAKVGDTIEVSFPGYDMQKVVVGTAKSASIVLTIGQSQEVIIDCAYPAKVPNYVTGGKGRMSIVENTVPTIEKERTFFGSIFHRIGNLFR